MGINGCHMDTTSGGLETSSGTVPDTLWRRRRGRGALWILQEPYYVFNSRPHVHVFETAFLQSGFIVGTRRLAGSWCAEAAGARTGAVAQSADEVLLVRADLLLGHPQVTVFRVEAIGVNLGEKISRKIVTSLLSRPR